MREIKFRAWHPEWDGLVYSQDFQNKFGKREFWPWIFEVGFSHYPKDDKWVIMQCTGLKDKNGKEIYEGDVVSVKIRGEIIVNGQPNKGFVFERMIVMFTAEQGLGRFVVVDKNGDAWSGLGATEIEVVGTIHDNPELLGGEINAHINTKT